MLGRDGIVGLKTGSTQAAGGCVLIAAWYRAAGRKTLIVAATFGQPGTFIFGNGGAPFFTALRWKSWGSGSAWGTGKLWAQKPGCSPSYKCTYSPRWVGVSLSTVRTHNGVRYYARMAVEFFVSGKARWVTGWFGIHAGTVPYWGFPAVFPYL